MTQPNCGCSQLMDVLAARGVEDNSPVARQQEHTTDDCLAQLVRRLKKHLVTDRTHRSVHGSGHRYGVPQSGGNSLYVRYRTLQLRAGGGRGILPADSLIVISADRPGQWIDQDDSLNSQAVPKPLNIVKKVSTFRCGTRHRYRAPTAIPLGGEWAANRLVNEAITVATTGRPGPVHINIQFANPLEATVSRDCAPPRTVETITDTSGIPSKISEELAGRLADKRCCLPGSCF